MTARGAPQYENANDNQDKISAERRWGADIAYTYALQRCLCQGLRPSSMPLSHANGVRPPLDTSPQQQKTHRIWVAFLKYDNAEYQPEQCMRDYTILPMNYLTTVVTGRNFIHCQILFWDELFKRYRTFSVDTARPVHVYDKKDFAAKGWRFFEIMVSEQQELTIYNFLIAQLGLPMNTAGFLSWPAGGLSGRGQAWFCSELASAALAEGGVIDFDHWTDINGHHYRRPSQVAPHNLYDYLRSGNATHTIRRLDGNPVTINTIGQTARQLGPIGVPINGLPPSIVRHVVAATTTIASHADLTSELAEQPDREALMVASMKIRRQK